VPVLIYNGQLDVILGPPLALEVLRQLPWGGTAAFTAAPKTVWRVPGGQVGGYVKQAGPLTHATIRLAGHLAPADSPAFTYDMVQRFVFQKGWEDKNQ
jgi:vitellogenic carboxypeptidase-like protein